MVSPESISDITDYVYEKANWDDAKLCTVLKNEIGDDISQENVFDLLFELNKGALVSRYSLDVANGMYNHDIYKYIPKGVRKKKTQSVLFKEFECFLYQCSEHGVSGTKVYDTLCDTLTGIAYAIARSSKEYQEASWG